MNQDWHSRLIRPTVRQMISDGMSVASILSAHGGFMSVDERDVLQKYQDEQTLRKEQHATDK